MREPEFRNDDAGAEAGFALILAILALMLLTFLGLTLAVTTSTELTIAMNFRWSEQAKYVAEAGIEVGKRYLRQAQWNVILPTCRQGSATTPAVPGDPVCASGLPMTAPPPLPPNFASPRLGPEGEATRNFELQTCDTEGNEGYGMVLDDPTWTYPFQNSSVFLAQSLSGTFTLWVRRPIMIDLNGEAYDRGKEDQLLLTAEGTAPFVQGSSTTSFALSNRAVRYLEVTLSKTEPGDCDNRTAQAGSGPTGSGFDQCDPIRKEGINPRGGTPGATQEVNPSTQ